MSDIAIKVNNLSKRYRIGLKEELHDTLTGKISSIIKSPFSNFKRLQKLSRFSNNGEKDDIIWAIKDISFEVKQGEVLGIIGKNGAGKSTLLKILSRITEPTSGKAKINGQVASLLEVGTGFHGELTGKENVFLNGAIMGMTKTEIDRKFKEILDFSGVDKFIDTPVKRYSSGMKVRLAFSVAAFLEPEILLIDEVLAVGDNEFQKKCLGKMDDVAKKGRTVLFVSHSMPSILRLCSRVILIDNGEIKKDDRANKVVYEYLKRDTNKTAKMEWENIESVPGNEFTRLLSVRMVDENEQYCETYDIRKQIGVEINFEILNNQHPIIPHIILFNDKYNRLFNAIDTNPCWESKRKIGTFRSIAWIPGNLLSEGGMLVDVLLVTFSPKNTMRHVHEEKVVSFDVVDYAEGDTARGTFKGHWDGAVRPLLKWTNNIVSE